MRNSGFTDSLRPAGERQHMSFYQAEPMQDWKPWPLSHWHSEPAITIIKGNIEAGLKAVKVKAWVVEGEREKKKKKGEMIQSKPSRLL